MSHFPLYYNAFFEKKLSLIFEIMKITLKSWNRLQIPSCCTSLVLAVRCHLKVKQRRKVGRNQVLEFDSKKLMTFF